MSEKTVSLDDAIRIVLKESFEKTALSEEEVEESLAAFKKKLAEKSSTEAR